MNYGCYPSFTLIGGLGYEPLPVIEIFLVGLQYAGSPPILPDGSVHGDHQDHNNSLGALHVNSGSHSNESDTENVQPESISEPREAHNGPATDAPHQQHA